MEQVDFCEKLTQHPTNQTTNRPAIQPTQMRSYSNSRSSSSSSRLVDGSASLCGSVAGCSLASPLVCASCTRPEYEMKSCKCANVHMLYADMGFLKPRTRCARCVVALGADGKRKNLSMLMSFVSHCRRRCRRLCLLCLYIVQIPLYPVVSTPHKFAFRLYRHITCSNVCD